MKLSPALRKEVKSLSQYLQKATFEKIRFTEEDVPFLEALLSAGSDLSRLEEVEFEGCQVDCLFNIYSKGN